MSLEAGPCHPSPAGGISRLPCPGRAPRQDPDQDRTGTSVRARLGFTHPTPLPGACPWQPLLSGPRLKGKCTHTHMPHRAASCGFLSPSISAAGPRRRASSRTVRSAPRPATPRLARARHPGPRSPIPAAHPGARSPARPRAGAVPRAHRLPSPGLQAEPYFGRWRRGPGQPCPEGRLFWAGQPEQLRPQGFPAGCAPGTEGTLGQGSPPSPPPHLPPRPRPVPSSILARPRSFPRPGTFSGARSLRECPEPCGHGAPSTGAHHAGAGA